MKAAVIGNYDDIYGFASAGMEIISVNNDEECAKAFRKTQKSDYAAVFITKNYAKAVDGMVTGALPAVMFIPSFGASHGDGIKHLHRLVEKAAGADIL